MPETNEPASQPPEKNPVGDFVERSAEEVRQQPVKSLVWAFAVGIFLTIFPVGRIVGLVADIIFALLRPALMLLGLVKISELLGERRK